MEEFLHPEQHPARQRAQAQGEDDLNEGLHQDGEKADGTALQGGGHPEGGGKQHQAHRVVNGYHQQQQPGQGAVRLVLAHHHEGGGGGGGGGNGPQSDGGGDGDEAGVDKMQGDEGGVHQSGGGHGLEYAHGDGLPAHAFELLQAELVADGEGDKAQGHLGDKIQGGHLLGGVEAQREQIQRADAVGAEQEAADQVGGDGGKVELFGQPGQQQAAHQGQGELDQNLHNGTSKV